MIVAFDTETTGISPELDELLQITIVDEKENILLESYIKPPTRTSWINAQKVNKIDPEDVKNAPSALELASKIKEIFDKADAIVGYNVGFDVAFVEKDCKIHIDKTKVIDCLKLFREECKKKKISLDHHKLGDAVDFYCPSAKADYLSNAHDASCDSIATMRVYLNQIEDKERYYKKPEMSLKSSAFLDNFFYEKMKERSVETTSYEDIEY